MILSVINPVGSDLSRSSSNDIFDNRKQIIPRQQMSSDWEKKYLDYLKELLPKFLKADSVDRLLDEQYMPIWIKAVTHETYSSKQNYEELELYGDKILGYTFMWYLMTNKPDLDKSQYSELNTYYMSKNQQAKMADRLELTDHIRVPEFFEEIQNLKTDVFESFAGALCTIQDMVNPGTGPIAVRKLMVHTMKGIEIDIDKSRGVPKTQVVQIFTRFGLHRPVEISPGNEITINFTEKVAKAIGVADPKIAYASADDKEKALKNASADAITALVDGGILEIDETTTTNKGRDVTFKVGLTNAQRRFLEHNGKYLGSEIIGTATAANKNIAKTLAYEKALETLNNHGITMEWAQQLRMKQDFEIESVKEYYGRASTNLLKNNLVSMYFYVPSKTDTSKHTIVQLIGLDREGNKTVLGQALSDDNDTQHVAAKTIAIKNFAEGKRVEKVKDNVITSAFMENSVISKEKARKIVPGVRDGYQDRSGYQGRRDYQDRSGYQGRRDYQDRSGYKGSYSRGGSNQSGYQGSYNRGGSGQVSSGRGGSSQSSYNRGGSSQSGYSKGSYNRGGSSQSGYNRGGYQGRERDQGRESYRRDDDREEQQDREDRDEREQYDRERDQDREDRDDREEQTGRYRGRSRDDESRYKSYRD